MLLQQRTLSFLGYLLIANVLLLTVHSIPLATTTNHLESRMPRVRNKLTKMTLRVGFKPKGQDHYRNAGRLRNGRKKNIEVSPDEDAILCFGGTICFQFDRDESGLPCVKPIEPRTNGNGMNPRLVDLASTGQLVARFQESVGREDLISMFGNPKTLLEQTQAALREKGANSGADALSVEDDDDYISVVLIWLQLQERTGKEVGPVLDKLVDNYGVWLNIYQSRKVVKGRVSLETTEVMNLLKGIYSLDL
ncbi:hypothetical protein DFJ43DRAFT_780830 [Lentinula guzmanii]|uniref:Uncharacterized protein n=1 Tax=Lentinula guzmanii TaxID=2804957 RepID=A0AA38JBW2_9AGAR|nr:hypothetical protein DFJ43DRAFT_780830 [Lentinula guzmanii]